ncbi:MAG: MarR family transcriptional regulator [Pseudomonadota bacterium]
MSSRAVVGVTDWKRTKGDLRRLARALDSGKRLGEADYELNFAVAGDLVAEITRERLRLLATLRAAGPLTVYALAKQLGRNYSNVHADVKRLLALGLVERDAAKRVLVPWKEIRIRLPLARAA